MAILDIMLPFGEKNEFHCRVSTERVLVHHRAPQAIADLDKRVRQALNSPLDFPALSQAVLPDDRIVIALDHHTPCTPALIRGCWDVMAGCGVNPADILVLRPGAGNESSTVDPRCQLPEDVRSQVQLAHHDHADEKSQAYLASVTSGERIYLSRDVVEADFVLCVGTIAYDPVLGYRGTNSVLYPGMSTTDAVRKAHGQGHDELGPNDVRSLRQTIDEVGWLLGVQFTLQVIPAGSDGVADVIAGATDAVFQRGKERLANAWQIDIDERPDLVVVAVDGEQSDADWTAIGAALATARQLVNRDGRILLLSDVASPLTPGLEMIRDSRTPRDALQPLRQTAPDDLVVATQVAQAIDRANVYLMSQLEDDLVEDMFMTPIATLDEARRLLETGGTCAFIESAQHCYGRVTATV